MRIAELLHIKDETQNEANPFYISFSDLMVMLCVFFVMLIAISEVKVGSFEKIRVGFNSQTQSDSLSHLAVELKTLTQTIGNVTVDLTDEGVRLDLPSVALFDSGSAIIKSNNLAPLYPALQKILNSSYVIDVEGHTDDQGLYQQLRTKDGIEIQTNWTLSGRRASSVVQYLNDFGFSNERLRIVGYSSNRPKIEIKNKSGHRLEQARTMNRRVSLLIR